MFRPRMPSRDGMVQPDMEERNMASAQLSHSMDPHDLECPSNWPLHRKLYTSFAAWLFTVSAVFGLTAYTTDLPLIVAEFGFNPNLPLTAISGYSLYLFGIFSAPIWTPHVTERIGRSIFYCTTLSLCGLFLLGAGFAKTFEGIQVLRFFAGFFGGPTIVLLEGTFAEIWSAEYTNTYYAVQATAQFVGAGLGPLVCGFILERSGNWRWSQWASAIFCGIALIFGVGISESYQREIPRRRARRLGRTLEQDPPLSGSTFGEIFKVTVMDPMLQVFTQPVVMLSTFFLTFNFAVVLQFFISVPAALGAPPPTGPGFSPGQIGLAFITAIAGGTLGALFVIIIEAVVKGVVAKRNVPMFAQVEYRLIPAMIGPAFVTSGLFWIGSTVGNPAFKPIVPIIGTGWFVVGVAMVIMSVVPYLFDAFAPAGTLSALTAAATTRILFAGILPLVILQFITNASPKWTFFTFGIISIPTWAIPFILFRFGPTLRAKSKYSKMPEGDSVDAGQKQQTREVENIYSGAGANDGLPNDGNSNNNNVTFAGNGGG